MAERIELARLMGVTDAWGNLVRVGSPETPPINTRIYLQDGIPFAGNERAIWTSSHLKILDNPDVVVREKKRMKTVPVGTTVWRSPVSSDKRV